MKITSSFSSATCRYCEIFACFLWNFDLNDFFDFAAEFLEIIFEKCSICYFFNDVLDQVFVAMFMLSCLWTTCSFKYYAFFFTYS